MREKHPLAGQIVKIKQAVINGPNPFLDGQDFWIEDWAENIFEMPWQQVQCRPTRDYGARMRWAVPEIAESQDVLFGNCEGIACLVHQSEIISEGGMNG